MNARWAEAAAALVLWLGVAALLWALGAWLLLVVMSAEAGEMPVDILTRVVLMLVLVAGIVSTKRSTSGYLIVALAAGCAAVASWSSFVGDSFLGAVIVVVAAVTAVAALARWQVARAAASSPQETVVTGMEAAPRSAAEIAVGSGFAIAGLLVLARALLELLEGLAELPGAGEHWAGDVILWLLFVLAIPMISGVALVAAARWAWRRRVGARGAVVLYLGAVGGAVAWIALEAAWFLGQGNYWGSLDDPLLWTPVAILVGAAAGLATASGGVVLRRLRPAA